MFKELSNLAAGVDHAFAFIFAISAIFIIGLTILMIFIVIRFNRKKGKAAQQFTGNVKLEILWTVIPFIIVMAMFYFGWMGFAPMRKVPADAMTIKAIGRMWEWEFDYGNGKLSKELVIPVNKPVRLDLVSEDVNHSLFIPAFRVKEDVIPGYNNYLWFTPYVVGEYDVLCTEYCGLLHSSMTSKTRVLSENEYNSWLENLVATGNIPDPEGLAILKNNGCIACHSLDGGKLVGPTFKGSFGSEQVVMEGRDEKRVLVDGAYIKESINDPNNQVVKGYNRGLMQSYETMITDEQLVLIIDYLKTIGANQ